ncbi:MAG: metal ABC transporter substrate-binding protein [Promethearchaeia archaeon]
MPIKKRNTVYFLITITILLIGLAGQIGRACPSGQNDRGIDSYSNSSIKDSGDSAINVLTTTQLLRDYAQQVIGGEGKVSVLIESGTCPGHYDYSPSDVDIAEKVDIVFCHGFEGEYLDNLLEAADNEDAKCAVGPLVNFSSWGNPNNAPEYVNVISNKLNDTYSQFNETFKENRDDYLQQIEDTKMDLKEKADQYDFHKRKAYINSNQDGFMGWLGFDIVGSWEENDNAMDPSDISALSDKAEENDAELIVMNYPSGTEVGKEVADDLGILSVALLNFPGVYETETYLEQLEMNVDLLLWKLEGHPDPRPKEDNLLLLIIGICGAVIIGSVAVVIVIKRKKNHKEEYNKNKNNSNSYSHDF